MSHYENGPTFKETFKDKKHHTCPIDRSSYFVAVDSEGNKLFATYAPESFFNTTIKMLASKEGVAEIHVYEQMYEYRQTLGAKDFNLDIPQETV